MRQERLLQVILSPHISEKASLAAEKRNVFVFQVVDNATKPEVKDAVESLFSTKVDTVRIVNVRPKARLFKNIEGKKKGWKKAYVTLQEGQKLDIVGAQ